MNLKTMKTNITTEKEAGRIYTPPFIVDNILDLSNYHGANILNKHVIDNSCGDGAFLCRIVTRYCEEFLRLCPNKEHLKSDLETFIHGIEIEKTEFKKCIENISAVANSFGISEVKWDILCEDALSVDKFNGKMDFVLGNPPYVRAEFPEIDDTYKNYLLERYSATYFPEKITAAGRAVYVERNFEMIDRSRFCVVYYNKDYTPARRKSGTSLAYAYAVKKKCEIINIF